MQSLQRLGCGREAARRLADAEVDATRRKILQNLENLRDFERTVVLQHDPAGANADPVGYGEKIGRQGLGRGTGERETGFGQPIRNPLGRSRNCCKIVTSLCPSASSGQWF